ncbi:hypothetical protein D9V86_08995 [Bacteroidetes/Chlorobi group bacterium ChocPot_Mid]|nr:MAG: hypothetical protein D9V86_08995 [Bacteroidetes/Chlorobi group bacterium ChocPot_Mid]
MKTDNLLKILIALAIIFIAATEVKGEPNAEVKIYDISDLFMDTKPIMNYDMLFGDIIKGSSFFVVERREPSFNYAYSFDKNGKIIKKHFSHIFSGIESVREYKYNDDGLISEVTEKRNNFSKTIGFTYKNARIVEVTESITSGKDDPIFERFDQLIYKIDAKGNITEVRGVSSKFLGLSKESVRLKIYDYDEMNRLKAIRDFANPDETRIFSYDDYVKR